MDTSTTAAASHRGHTKHQSIMGRFLYATAIRRRLLVGLAVAWLGCCGLVQVARAAPGAPAAPGALAQTEVAALLASLQASGCRFQRNGSWHSAAEAHKHLALKWKEMQRRRQSASTEAFIEHVATSSSMTGQPYQVQCGNAPPQPSATWLRARLQALRAGGT